MLIPICVLQYCLIDILYMQFVMIQQLGTHIDAHSLSLYLTHKHT